MESTDFQASRAMTVYQVTKVLLVKSEKRVRKVVQVWMARSATPGLQEKQEVTGNQARKADRGRVGRWAILARQVSPGLMAAGACQGIQVSREFKASREVTDSQVWSV